MQQANKDMDLAISTTFNTVLSLHDMAVKIRQAGFQLISLSGSDYKELDFLRASGREAIHETCQKQGITIDSIHAPLSNTIDISHSESGIREYSVQIMKQAIHACTELQCSLLIVHLSRRFPEDALPERIVGARHSLEELIQYAKNKNVRIALENLISPSSNQLFRTMLNEVTDPILGVCLDTSHAHVTKQLHNLVQDYAGRIIAVHISDNKGMLDDHMLPYEGTIEWQKFVHVFSQIGYTGAFLLEVEMRESMFNDVQIFLEQAYARGKKLAVMIEKEQT